MEPQITEEQKKSLTLFAYYCRSHGAETVYREYNIEYCEVEWSDDDFQSPDVRTSIEGYEKINTVLDEILTENNLIENATNDCDLRGNLTLDIDCVNKVLSVSAIEWQYSFNESGDSKTLEEISEEFSEETYNEVIKLFEKIGENGEGEIRFQGGGDDGEIEDNIEINGSSESVPKLIYDMVYQWLTDTGIDWYNNEGGQGSFVFRPKDSEITLLVEQNYEEDVSTISDFEIHF
jgi:hypothetical protein